MFVRWNYHSLNLISNILVWFGSPRGLPSRGNKAMSIAKMSIQQRLLKMRINIVFIRKITKDLVLLK
jgi:hypothetical protein